ncbi:hypothetical protein MZM54_03395 [[Brevibacterium] frigoritolerans]|nr:hypothetical protein [Peribacillus frigoritolerans]
MKKAVVAIISSLVFVVSGCGQTTKEEDKTIEPKVNAESKEEVSMKETEVKSVLKKNVDSIMEVFKQSGTENNWSEENPLEFEKLRPELLPYATESFTDSTLKEEAASFYCECDSIPVPQLNYDVRFSFTQDKENELFIKALEPASETLNMGSTWEIKLVKEKNKWKMDQWMRNIEEMDLKLTKKEAKKLVSVGSESVTYNDVYESGEAEGKAYIFNVKKLGEESVVAISSKDTRLVYDYDEEEKKVIGKKTDSTLKAFDFYSEYLEGLHFGYTKDQLIAEFGEPTDYKQSELNETLSYPDALYVISRKSGQVYRVKVYEKQAAQYYKDFEAVSNAFNFDEEYAQYEEIKESGKDGHRLIYNGWQNRFTFTSKNENGNPIESILVNEESYR